MTEPKEVPAVREHVVTDLVTVETELNNRIAVMTRIHEVLTTMINPDTDIDRVGSEFRRNANYARKVFRLVGGSFEYLKDDSGKPLVVRTDYEDSSGRYYTYEAYGRYTFPERFGGMPVEATGLASSRDPFLGQVDGEFRPVDQVNEAFIRQKALTECFKKAVFTAMGFGALTDADLAKAKKDTTKTPGHTFEKGKQGGAKATTAEGKVSREEIERMCREMFDGGYKVHEADRYTSPEDLLEALTKGEGGFTGWRRFKAISEKSLPRTHKQVKEHYAKFNAAAAGAPAASPAAEGEGDDPFK